MLAVRNTYQYGGPQMIVCPPRTLYVANLDSLTPLQLVAWPMSGLLSMFLTLTLSELASAYPVAGAMASWAWKCARGGVGGERKWGWLLGGIVLAGHASAVSRIIAYNVPTPQAKGFADRPGCFGDVGDLRYHLGFNGSRKRLSASDLAFGAVLPRKLASWRSI